MAPDVRLRALHYGRECANGYLELLDHVLLVRRHSLLLVPASVLAFCKHSFLSTSDPGPLYHLFLNPSPFSSLLSLGPHCSSFHLFFLSSCLLSHLTCFSTFTISSNFTILRACQPVSDTHFSLCVERDAAPCALEQDRVFKGCAVECSSGWGGAWSALPHRSR